MPPSQESISRRLNGKVRHWLSDFHACYSLSFRQARRSRPSKKWPNMRRRWMPVVTQGCKWIPGLTLLIEVTSIGVG